jgi:hypothetical protein
MVPVGLRKEGTEDGRETLEGLNQAVSEDGRYWARTSDPQLVESADPARAVALSHISGLF